MAGRIRSVVAFCCRPSNRLGLDRKGNEVEGQREDSITCSLGDLREVGLAYLKEESLFVGEFEKSLVEEDLGACLLEGLVVVVDLEEVLGE